MLRVNNLLINGKAIANHFIMHNEDNLYIFQSYKSIIAEVDLDVATVIIYKDWKYSTTTSKYRNKFFAGLGFYEIATTEGLKEAIKNGGFSGYKVIFKDVNP